MFLPLKAIFRLNKKNMYIIQCHKMDQFSLFICLYFRLYFTAVANAINICYWITLL